MKIKEDGHEKLGLTTLFANKEKTVKFGTAIIAPGERIPAVGVSCHFEHEYSVIVKGKIAGESGGEAFEVGESAATFIPAGEEHWAINNSDVPCEIVWLLVNEQ